MTRGGVTQGTLAVECTTFDSLRDAWAALLPAAVTPLPFQSVQWNEAWWTILGGDAEQVLLSVRDDAGVLVGIAPLMICPTELGRTLRFIGGVDLVDYLDMVAAEPDIARVWEAVIAALMAMHERWDALDFHCLPPWSPSRGALTALIASSVPVESAREEVCPVARLGGSFNTYLRALEKKERHEIRRKARNFERDVPGGVLRVLIDRDAALAALPEFFRLHRLSAPDKERFWTPDTERFFHAMTAAMADAGWLRLYILEIDDVAVATMYTLVAHDRLLIYNSGFDPEYSRFSVGMVLTGMMLEEAADHGLAIADFLRGNETYKYRFGATDTPIWRVVATDDRAALERTLTAMARALGTPADERDLTVDERHAMETDA